MRKWVKVSLSCFVLLFAFPFIGLLIYKIIESDEPSHALGAETPPQFIDFSKGQVAYWSTGDDQHGSIIYCHGSPGDASNWKAYFDRPVLEASTIVYDRPGFGYTEPRRVVSSVALQADALSALLQNQNQPSIVVGHSMGVPIAIQATLDNPSLVKALVLLAGTLDPEYESPRWYNHLAAQPGLRALLPRMLRHSNEELLPLKSELKKLQHEITQWKTPVTVLHAPNDKLVPFQHVHFMKELFGESMRLEILDGKGHLLPWNSEPEVRSAVERAIRKNSH